MVRQFHNLRADSMPDRSHEAVTADIRRGAELIEPGLDSFIADERAGTAAVQ
ncbi:hypothetical protein ACH4OY_14925 [Micromonospora rubida]|uniref:Uncharacterized protein n=1 Tax=Micromonospora rubida TaxID=2697657 RepID=A0ABW7SMM2_9ACTN